jgi:hypothetical protein
MRICVNHTGEKKLWKFVRAVENGLGDCVAPTALAKERREKLEI